MKRILSMIVVMALVFTLLGAAAVFAGDKDEANDEAVITSEESQGENESVEVAKEGSEENTEVAGEAGSEEKNSEEASEAQGEEAEALTQTPDDGIALIDDATYTWSGDSSAISDSDGTITISGGTIVSDGTTGVIGGSDGNSVIGNFTISGGTFDGTTEADVSFLQSNATDAVAKLSTDDDCYYVGADAIKAAVEAYTGTDTLTLTVVSGDLTLDVEKDIYVVNSGSGSVTVNGVSVPAGKTDPTLCPKQANPQTGDASSLYLWAVLALAALLGGAVAIRKFAVRR